MPNPLLTIVIPTYDRAECLSLLLTTLVQELRGLEDKVEVIVGDNASSDHTPIVTEAFLKVYPSANVLRHSENLGPEENFCKCIDEVKTRFFWIIGDDDLPKFGVLRKIINVLEFEDSDILYVNSEWMPHITNASNGGSVSILTTKLLTRKEFARQVNVWITFISGMIVNLTRLHELNPNLVLRRFTGTYLVQLGWILPLLMTGSRFRIIEQRCVLATSDNTGGYKLFTVFGTNLPSILNTVCGSASPEYKIIFKILSWSYIPGLLWKTRFGHAGNFITENALKGLTPIKRSSAYWLIILPLATLPRQVALPLMLISKIFLLQHRIFNYITLHAK
jgi:abequosyltransferase